ncbi:hypothetical protein Tco_0275365, partial [Tanacetum coccineum]
MVDFRLSISGYAKIQLKVDSISCRIPLPGLSYAIQSLPMGNYDLIGGGGPTCALTEVPVITGNNGNNVSNPQHVE